MAVIFSDSFTRANAASLGANYSNDGAHDDFSVASNQAAAGTDSAAAYNGASVTSGYVQMKLISGTTGSFTSLRLVPSLADFGVSGYNFTFDPTGGTCRIRKDDGAGAHTTLVSGMTMPVDGDIVKFERNGTTLTAYINGVSVGSTTDGSNSGPFYGVLTGTTGLVVDDVEFGNLVKRRRNANGTLGVGLPFGAFS